MDGYTVDEAATVLGIPQGRVWELLARGVLSGTPEGQSGMRVFLKEDRADLPASKEGERRGGNGDVEMSPFRELLSEFRNLTERYGQALLALGEARGEVASLRTRVELLETRVDIGLPSTRRMNTVAWELSDAPPPRARPTHDAEPPPAPSRDKPQAEATGADAVDAPVSQKESPPPTEAADVPVATDAAETADDAQPVAAEAPAEPDPAEPAADVPTEPATRRVRSGRIGGPGSFAEALARAQDPTLSQLPGAGEAAEALAELQRDIAQSGGHEQVEDHIEALDARSGVDAPMDDVAADEPVEESVEESVEEPVEEPVAQQESETADAGYEALEYLPEPVIAEAVSLGEIALEEDEPSAEAVAPEQSLEAVPREDEPEEQPAEEPAATAALADPDSPYSAEVVEPDWFADGDFTWLDAAQAPTTAEEPEAPAVEMEPAVTLESPDVEADTAADTPEREDTREEPADEAPVDVALEPGPPPPATQPFGGFRAPRDEPTTLVGTDQPEEELMFLGDEFEASSLEASGAGWRAATSTDPARDVAPEEPKAPLIGELAPPEPATAPAPQPDAGVRAQVLELSDRELEQLANDEGWDVEEVQAIRTFLGRPESHEPDPAEPDPHHAEARQAEAQDGRAESDGPYDRAPTTTTQEPAEAPALGALRQPPYPMQLRGGPGQPGDADWLQGRRGPAANAYRRLRRLFPG